MPSTLTLLVLLLLCLFLHFHWGSAFFAALIAVRIVNAQMKTRLLTQKFGAEAAGLIQRGQIWQGASEAMIVASRGTPAAVDERVYKFKTQRVFKYYPTGKNRYAQRVTFEDGACTGWEERG